MIGRDELGSACRRNDAETLDFVLRQLGVEPAALTYVAWQRALRAYMLLSDHPRVPEMAAHEPFQVEYPAEDEALIRWMAAAWIDGVAAFWRLTDGRDPT